jgi:hypothetical protein
MLGGVTVKEGAKDELVIEGNDIENVSQSAASITDKCRVKEKDVCGTAEWIFPTVLTLRLFFHRSESSWTVSTPLKRVTSLWKLFKRCQRVVSTMTTL